MSPVALPTHSAVVLHGPADLRLEERTVWPPQTNHVQVAVVCTGVCGSDMHYFLHGRNGDFAVRRPLVLGHETAGYVTAVGKDVEGIHVGQRVAIEPGIYCRTCDNCKRGRYNLCRSMRFCSSAAVFPHADGTLQEFVNHPAYIVHPLPDNCSFELGALAEPLSVLIHASRRVGLAAGQTVLVYGVGAIGLLACALARSKGASCIVAIDNNPTRLNFAMSHGFASQTFCTPPAAASDKVKTPDDQLRRAKEIAQAALAHFDAPNGFDVVFECTGAEPIIQMSIHTAITGGKVMLIGMGTRNTMFPLSSAALREVDILGSFRYANTYPEALALLASGKLKNVDKIVTHRVPLKEAKRAFDLLAKGKDDKGNMVLKVMIQSTSS